MNRALLAAEVSASYEDHGDLVTYHIVDPGQVGQADVALALEHIINVAGSKAEADVPFFDVADALDVLRVHPRHQGDVAEPGAAEVAEDRLARRDQPVELRG